MRWIAVASILMFVGAGCASGSDDADDGAVTPVALSLAEAEQQLNEDAIASLVGSWTIRYRVRTCEQDQVATCTDGSAFEFTWYKDGRDRQRLDFSGASTGGELFGLTGDTQVLIPVNDRTSTTLCSSGIAVDIRDDGVPAETSVCCDGTQPECDGASDTAANIVYGELGFLLEYPEGDLTGSTAFSDAEIVGYEEREIAGVNARCYRATSSGASPDREPRTVELCYAADGAELYRDGWTFFSRVLIEALEVKQGVDDSDFDLPYRVIPDE